MRIFRIVWVQWENTGPKKQRKFDSINCKRIIFFCLQVFWSIYLFIYFFFLLFKISKQYKTQDIGSSWSHKYLQYLQEFLKWDLRIGYCGMRVIKLIINTQVLGKYQITAYHVAPWVIFPVIFNGISMIQVSSVLPEEKMNAYWNVNHWRTYGVFSHFWGRKEELVKMDICL